MIRVQEAIIVEGRYDKNAVLQVVSAVVLETEGFQIFKNGEKRELLKRLAEKRGIIVLTDSDGAGFLIRNHLKGVLPKDRVKHAYIPDIPGKERRKTRASKEGTLGVEGMPPEVILEALKRAGATLEGGEKAGGILSRALTEPDLYELGLAGRENSREKRTELLRRLQLPEKLSAKAFLDVLNALYSREEIEKLLDRNKLGT